MQRTGSKRKQNPVAKAPWDNSDDEDGEDDSYGRAPWDDDENGTETARHAPPRPMKSTDKLVDDTPVRGSEEYNMFLEQLEAIKDSNNIEYDIDAPIPDNFYVNNTEDRESRHLVTVVDRFTGETVKVAVTDKVKELVDADIRNSVPQRSNEWYTRRRNRITASSVPAILGEDAWKDRVATMWSKLRKTDGSIDQHSSTAMRHGIVNEPYAIKLYEILTKKKVLEFGLMDSINPGEKIFAASPDGITQDGILIEVKCPYSRIPKKGVVPKQYVGQLQYQLHIFGLETAHFVEYVPPTKWEPGTLIITVVLKDPNWIVRARPVLQSFWDDLVSLRNRKDLEYFLQLPVDHEEQLPALRKMSRRIKRRAMVENTMEVPDEPLSEEEIERRMEEIRKQEQLAMDKKIDEAFGGGVDEFVLRELDKLKKKP